MIIDTVFCLIVFYRGGVQAPERGSCWRRHIQCSGLQIQRRLLWPLSAHGGGRCKQGTWLEFTSLTNSHRVSHAHVLMKSASLPDILENTQDNKMAQVVLLRANTADAAKDRDVMGWSLAISIKSFSVQCRLRQASISRLPPVSLKAG